MSGEQKNRYMNIPYTPFTEVASISRGYTWVGCQRCDRFTITSQYHMANCNLPQCAVKKYCQDVGIPLSDICSIDKRGKKLVFNGDKKNAKWVNPKEFGSRKRYDSDKVTLSSIGMDDLVQWSKDNE